MLAYSQPDPRTRSSALTTALTQHALDGHGTRVGALRSAMCLARRATLGINETRCPAVSPTDFPLRPRQQRDCGRATARVAERPRRGGEIAVVRRCLRTKRSHEAVAAAILAGAWMRVSTRASQTHLLVAVAVGQTPPGCILL